MPERAVEDVRDYPRPPRVEPTDEHVVVVLGGETVVDTRRAVRVLETFHAPTYYVPVDDVADGALRPAAGQSFCEFKGVATYYDVVAGDRTAPRAAWTYRDPSPGFEVLAGRVALYAGPMDEVSVDGERVVPQPGDFYGGWVTSRVTGPVKGAPGTLGW